jgi:hypothetical protein
MVLLGPLLYDSVPARFSTGFLATLAENAEQSSLDTTDEQADQS